MRARPLESGWLPDTPVEDSLLRRFVHNQAEVNEVIALAVGGRVERTDGVFLADTAGPVPYFNQAILARPLVDAADSVLDAIEAFFACRTGPASLLSIWPTADLAHRGWQLVGHPMLVVRAPGRVAASQPDGVEVKLAEDPDDFATAERIAVEGYPLDQARGLAAGQIFPPSVAEAGMVVRLGTYGGEPVAVGNCYVGHGVVNLCMGATLPEARRRGVWQALVWARVGDAPHLPAVAYTSDHSRPGFERMGFLPLTRFTLWAR